VHYISAFNVVTNMSVDFLEDFKESGETKGIILLLIGYTCITIT